MNDRAITVASQALQTAKSLGFPITQPLVDKETIGSFYVRVGVTIGTGDTNVAIQLTRKPSAYSVLRSSNGGVVYDGATPANWTGLNITLRSTVAGNVVTVAVA
jgi:hypothetical protein